MGAQPTVIPGDAPPWWLDEAPPGEEAPPLEGDVEADVAIVGAGFTGLWTALALRDRAPSARVVVLDARHSGAGPSGRNGGFLHGYWSSLARLRERFGAEGALAIARASAGAIAAVRALEDDVWLREGGYLKVSTAAGQDASVDLSVAIARELGVEEEAVPVSGAELEERCRSPRFRRGVLFRDGATVQPARLVRALRRRALAAGVELYERSSVTQIRAGLLETGKGSVRAEELVVATNAWAAGWGPLRRRLTNFGSYVVLTEPVPELLEELGWTGGEAIVDARNFVHYFRTTADGRVLMGSGSGPIGFGGRVGDRFSCDAGTAARAEQGLRRLLPGLVAARITHAWGGPVDVSVDLFPLFGTVAGTRIHYGAGYSGNGVGPSWLGGRILASLVLGAEDELTALPLVNRRAPRLPPEPLRFLAGALLRRALIAREDAEAEGRRVPLALRPIGRLPRWAQLRIGTR